MPFFTSLARVCIMCFAAMRSAPGGRPPRRGCDRAPSPSRPGTAHRNGSPGSKSKRNKQIHLLLLSRIGSKSVSRNLLDIRGLLRRTTTSRSNTTNNRIMKQVDRTVSVTRRQRDPTFGAAEEILPPKDLTSFPHTTPPSSSGTYFKILRCDCYTCLCIFLFMFLVSNIT